MSTTALIDSDSIVYAVAFGKEAESEESAIAALDETIYTICDEVQADYNLFFLSDPTHDFRRDLCPTYKAGRKQRPGHYEVLRDHMIGIWCADVSTYCEADDTISLMAIDTDQHTNIITHIDKDLNLINGQHYNYRKKEWYEVSRFQGMYNFYMQMLMGDRVDNVKGVKGIGPITAEKLLKDCVTEDDMFYVVDKAYPDKRELLMTARLLWLLSTTRTNLIFSNYGELDGNVVGTEGRSVEQDRPAPGDYDLRDQHGDRMAKAYSHFN